MTPPLTPPDCNLRDFPFMPLDVARLAQSDMIATATAPAIVADLLLWCASWHQIPAASLPNDDRVLANLAGFGRVLSAWMEVRDEVLERWVECDDGRLYHPVVAEKAREAFAAKLAQRHRSFLAAIRKHNERNRDDERASVSFDQWEAMGRPKEVATVPPKRADGEMPKSGQNVAEQPKSDQTLPSRRTRKSVARDNGDASPVTGDEKTRDSASKGQGQGQGQGQGDSNNNNNTHDAPKPLVVVDDAAFDLVGIADQLARRAGVPNTQPSQISRNTEVVREWHRDGISIPEIVLPEIDRFRADKPEDRIATLRFFDASVRARLARIEAKSRQASTEFRSTSNAPPVAALAAQDEDNDPTRAVRAKLNGKPDYTPDRIALALVDGTLTVTARSSFVASRLDRDTLAEAAGLHVSEVEVRVA